jgi:DNA polymerase-3 subunit alpha
MLTEGCTVFITAKSVQKYRDSNFYDLRVSDIQYLQTVKENRIEKFTIIADSDAIDDTVVNDIISMVGGKSGKTQLYFQIRDTKTNNTVLLRSTNKTINLSYDLVSYIEENPNMRYHVN